jgi:membrane protease YdiL (CAAX protease family)
MFLNDVDFSQVQGKTSDVMLDDELKIQSTIVSIIMSNLSILLIFVFWFLYSVLNMVLNLIFISFSIIILGSYVIICIYKKRLKTRNLTALGVLIMVLFFFLVDTIFYFIPNINPFFFSFFDLFGLIHSFDLGLFLLLSSILLIKILSIYLYIRLRSNVIRDGRGDAFFQYFSNGLDRKKRSLLGILFPLSALVEELIYRSLFLSFLVYYFNFNLVMGIILGSFVFALVHYSTTNDSGYMVSLIISSVIYFIALIELGLLFAWIYHLLTNVTVLFFYYRRRSKSPRELS